MDDTVCAAAGKTVQALNATAHNKATRIAEKTVSAEISHLESSADHRNVLPVISLAIKRFFSENTVAAQLTFAATNQR